MIWPLCILFAFACGSIPFGLIIGRLRGIDIREHGSRNIGATNVGRVLGRSWGFLCFALDLVKGAGPVVLAGFLAGVINRPAVDLTQTEMWLWMLVAVAAVLGHMYSPFVRFRGGKGVATAFGALVAMWPLMTLPALGAIAVWYAALRLWRYVSVASMVAAVSLPIFYVFGALRPDGAEILATLLHTAPPLLVTLAMAALVIFKHRTNIARLRRGEEPKVSHAARRGAMVHDTR